MAEPNSVTTALNLTFSPREKEQHSPVFALRKTVR
jgi:hypothetical protein